MKFVCGHCGETASKAAGHVNRARDRGLNLYCNRRCAGFGRRTHKTKTQKVEEKRLYDAEYRTKNAALLKAKKAARHKATYDPKAAALIRKARMPLHVEYCRRPAYRAKKKVYDSKRRAAVYGPAAEAFMMLLDLNREIKGRMTNHEIRQANGTFGKRQARAREAASEREKAARHRDQAS